MKLPHATGNLCTVFADRCLKTVFGPALRVALPLADWRSRVPQTRRLQERLARAGAALVAGAPGAAGAAHCALLDLAHGFAALTVGALHFISSSHSLSPPPYLHCGISCPDIYMCIAFLPHRHRENYDPLNITVMDQTFFSLLKLENLNDSLQNIPEKNYITLFH